MNPIETIFGLCDAESDEKLSLNEILENDAECWNMLEYVGMQKTTISDEFSMIDKDQNGYVTMDEAYDAAKTLDRKGEKTAAPEQSIYSFNGINMFLRHSLKNPLKSFPRTLRRRGNDSAVFK